jgi:hypothetical protein
MASGMNGIRRITISARFLGASSAIATDPRTRVTGELSPTGKLHRICVLIVSYPKRRRGEPPMSGMRLADALTLRVSMTTRPQIEASTKNYFWCSSFGIHNTQALLANRIWKLHRYLVCLLGRLSAAGLIAIYRFRASAATR